MRMTVSLFNVYSSFKSYLFTFSLFIALFALNVSGNVYQHKFTTSTFTVKEPIWLNDLKIAKMKDFLIAPFSVVYNQSILPSQHTYLYEIRGLERFTAYELRISYPPDIPADFNIHMFPASKRYFVTLNATTTGSSFSSINQDRVIPFTVTVEEYQFGVIPVGGWPVVAMAFSSALLGIFLVTPTYISKFTQFSLD